MLNSKPKRVSKERAHFLGLFLTKIFVRAKAFILSHIFLFCFSSNIISKSVDVVVLLLIIKCTQTNKQIFFIKPIQERRHSTKKKIQLPGAH